MIDTRYAPINERDCASLLRVAEYVKNRNTPMHIADIGSATGSSAKLFSTLGKVYSVDPFLIDPSVKDVFLENVKGLDVELFHTTSAEASREVIDGLDLVFIDGSHNYKDVKKDIQMWYSKLHDGGVICGHDCIAIAEGGRVNLRPYQDYTRETKGRDTVCFHAGVILAVSDSLPKAKIMGDQIWWGIKNG